MNKKHLLRISSCLRQVPPPCQPNTSVGDCSNHYTTTAMVMMMLMMKMKMMKMKMMMMMMMMVMV